MLSLGNRRTGSLRNMRSRFRLSVTLKTNVLHVPKGEQGKRKKTRKVEEAGEGKTERAWKQWFDRESELRKERISRRPSNYEGDRATSH